MAVRAVAFKPIVEALEDIETSAAQVVLAAAEQEPRPAGDLGVAIARLASALWELQTTRERVAALASEVGTPPLHVVEVQPGAEGHPPPA